MKKLNNRLQYTINHVGYHLDGKRMDEEQAEAVSGKYEQEQTERNEAFQKMLIKSFGKVYKREFDPAEAKKVPRTEDAVWHISYDSSRDKQWGKTLRKELGCRNIKLYPSNDECLKPFKMA